MPEQPEPVSIELLQDLADQFSNQALPSSGEPVSEPQPGTLDVRRYLERYGRIMLRETTRGESTLHVLDSCVFDPDHAGGEAAIGQQANGLLFYQCFHESCRGKTWREARQIISGNDRLGSFMSTAGNSACATAAENPQQIEIFSFADVLRMPEDTTPPVIEGILYPRESLLITGPAAIGKSTMVLHCCLSIASGRRFLNQYQTTVSRRILLIQGENSFRTLRDRLTTMTMDFTGTRAEALGNIFTPWQHGSPQLIGAIGDRWGKPTAFVQTLESLIVRTESSVIFFDPLISYHAGDEKDNTVMRKVLDILTSLSIRHGLTVILTHHHGKTQQDGYLNARGASAIVDWACSVLTLTKDKARSKRENRHILNAEWTKVRSFRPPDPIKLELLQGATFTRLDADNAGISSGEVVSILEATPDRRIVGRPQMIQAIRNAHELSRDRAGAALNSAIADGSVLRTRDAEDGRRVIFELPHTDNADDSDEEDLL